MSMQAQSVTDTTRSLADTLAASTPGVELVLPTTAVDDAITVQSMKLLGSLQRRTWKRQSEMLQRRSMESLALVADPVSPVNASTAVVAVDLADTETWDQRLEMLRLATVAIAEGTAPFVVRTRGWDSTEIGVLVDGRAIAGAVFDAAMMISAGVEQFRQGKQPFVFLVPEPDDAAAANLWTEMVGIAEDRMGIDRGTIRIGSRLAGRN